MRLKDRIAVITGGGRGIGRGIADVFVREGAKVVLADIILENAEKSAKEIHDAGGTAVAMYLDVTKEENVKKVMADTVAKFGRLDILVSNAGIMGPTADAVDMDANAWRATIDVNLTGVFLCAKHGLPYMMKQKSGNVINMSSIAGTVPYRQRTPYAASKWAVRGLTASLAQEAGDYGIRVNAICPAGVEGDNIRGVISDRAKKEGKSYEQVMEEVFTGDTCLKRMVQVEDVAELALFFASDASKNITGQSWKVCAGKWTLT